jgi:microcompartment protein CcmK/EutM
MLDRHLRQLDVNVDAIDQGTGDAIAIARGSIRRAAAAAARIAGIATRTWVHGATS